jgi:predicted dehydrogenase
MKTYGVLLIGCGHIGMQHLLDIYYRKNIKVVAVADTNAALAKEAAARCGAEFSTDYRKFLSREDIDIVIIATYTASHLSILKDCLAAQKNVLCEKPIAGSLESGREFVEAVKASDKKVLVAHILRHNRSYIKVRELIKSGAIGELRVVRMAQNHHAMNWPRYKRLLCDCSPTVDCGVHYYDLLRWLTGSEICEVSGIGTKTQNDSPEMNYTLSTIKMENGCVAFYEAGWGQNIRSCNLKEFIGTDGRITLELKAQRSRDCEEGDLITVYHGKESRYETINVQAQYKEMYSQFETLIDMIENNSPGNPTTDDVWKAFAAAKAADRAIKTGQKIKITTFPLP